ncbi:MAG: hypothetical protein NVSMB9_31780 [Isosphaeraceae bacterium]
MNVDEDTRLSAYLDGELPPEHCREIESTLISDPAQARQLAAFSTLRELVGGLPRPKAPESLADSVVSQIHRRSSRKFGVLSSRLSSFWPRRTMLPIAAAAALLGATTIGLFWVSRTQTPLPGQTGPVAQAGPLPERLNNSVAADSVVRDREVLVGEPGSSDSPNSPPMRDEDRAHQDTQQRDIHRLLEDPSLRKLFIVSDVQGGAEGRVGELIKKTPRRQSSYGRITLTQGILLDPRNPSQATVFALVMDEDEVEKLQKTLESSFPDALQVSEKRPELLDQLAENGQISVHEGTSFPSPASRPPSEDLIASREERKDQSGITALSPEPLDVSSPDPLQDPTLYLDPTGTLLQRSGPTPEQKRSGPHRSLRTKSSPPVMAGRESFPKSGRDGEGDRRPGRRGGSLVLVFVKKPRSGG